MESWRLCWRNGFAHVLPTKGLQGLLAALEKDDPRLTQGSTTTPAPLMCVQDWPAEGADAIAFVGWAEQDMQASVGELEEFFAKACFDCDQHMSGEPAACRWFLCWFDDTPRPEMRRELIHEVRLVLMARTSVAEALGGPVPEGFVRDLVDSNYRDGTAFLVLADWLDEDDRPEQAASCRAAAGRVGT